jgi:hypothetical protein
MRIRVSKLILTVRGRGDAVSQGTWVHRRVAIDLARWLSPNPSTSSTMFFTSFVPNFSPLVMAF